MQLKGTDHDFFLDKNTNESFSEAPNNPYKSKETAKFTQNWWNYKENENGVFGMFHNCINYNMLNEKGTSLPSVLTWKEETPLIYDNLFS